MTDETNTDSTENSDVLGSAFGTEAKGDGNPLEALVGEGKKFRSPADLAKAKLESDKFIEKLKSENRELRELVEALDSKVSSSSRMSDLIERLKSTVGGTGDSNGAASTTDASASATKPEHRNQSVSLTSEDVISLLEQRENAKKVAENTAYVNRELVKSFGKDAAAVVRQRATELGLAESAVRTLAETSPKAFLALVNGTARNAASGVTMRPGAAGRGDTNTAAYFADASSREHGEVRDKAYYDKRKQEMGAVKFATNTELQIQMHKDMERLGDRFFGA